MAHHKRPDSESYFNGPPASEVELRWNRAFRTFLHNADRLTLFRDVAHAGLRAGVAEAAPQHLGHLPSKVAVLNPPHNEVADDPERLRFLFDYIASRDVEEALNAALLVFSHATLEQVVSDVLGILLDGLPHRALAQCGSRKVTLEEAVTLSPDALAAKVRRAFHHDLTRGPLKARVSLILSLCKDSPQRRGPEGYVFSLDRIATVDRPRQSLLHRVSWSTPDTIEADLLFASATCWFLLTTCSRQLHLRICAELPSEDYGA